MLRSRCDALGDHLLVDDGDRIEQLAAELGEQPDGRDGLLHATPAAAGVVEHRPHQRKARALAGEAADDLDPPTCLTEGPLDEVGVPDAAPVLSGEAQERDQVLEVVLEAGDGSGVELAPAGGERLGPPPGLGHRLVARRGVDVVEDGPVLDFTLAWA